MSAPRTPAATTGTLIMGIDPGLSGAVALYHPGANVPVAIHDMPLSPPGKSGKRSIDLFQLAALIDGYAADTKIAIIEEVHAMPGQGVTSMFRFGFATGAITGIVAANYVPYLTAHPAAWKAAMGLSFNKDLSREKAAKLFPHFSHYFERKKDDGRAEALLLAVFAARGMK